MATRPRGVHPGEDLGVGDRIKRAKVVHALPKTRSGKILRSTIRKIADREPWEAPPTIEDPATLDAFVRLLPTIAGDSGAGGPDPGGSAAGGRPSR